MTTICNKSSDIVVHQHTVRYRCAFDNDDDNDDKHRRGRQHDAVSPIRIMESSRRGRRQQQQRVHPASKNINALLVAVVVIVSATALMWQSSCHAFHQPSRLHFQRHVQQPKLAFTVRTRQSSSSRCSIDGSTFALNDGSRLSSTGRNENGKNHQDRDGRYHQDLSQNARRIIVSSVATLMFLLSSFVGIGHVIAPGGGLSAWAVDDNDAVTVTEVSGSRIDRDSSENLATVAAAATSNPPTESTLLQGLPTTSRDTNSKQDDGSAVVDEVWNLINKYYIDRSFNGLNWDDARAKALLKTEKLATNANGDIKNKEVLQVVTEMVNSLGDKYTRILTNDQYAAIQKFDLIGVGVTLMPSPVSKDIIVGAPPIEGSSSYKAGLKVGDYVVSVNGKPTRGRTAFDIIDQISEDPNAKTVTFGILRKKVESSIESLGDINSAEIFDVTLDRQTMEVKDPVTYKISETRKDGTNVGYIRVSEFNAIVQSSMMNAIQDLKHQGANAYVLDLRSNTGGAFQSAVEISGLFLPPDRVATYVVDSNQVEMPFRTPSAMRVGGTSGSDHAPNANPSLPLVDADVPLVIWIDSLSASASEVLVGSLHDNCRAVTMGNTNSFGKGLIQAVYGLKNGAGLVLTVAKYITPAGTEIQGIGLKPDISGSMPAPVFIPGLSTDTSKVDFKDVSKRLSSEMCSVPKERVMVGAGGIATSAARVDNES